MMCFSNKSKLVILFITTTILIALVATSNTAALMKPTLAQTVSNSTANMNITRSTTNSANSAATAPPRSNNPPLPSSTVHVTKDSTLEYSITKGTALIGSFGNSYSITGDSKSLVSSKDLIISTVQDDFIKSPSAGYVLARNNTAATTTTSNSGVATGQNVANPFASISTIKQNIQSKITESINSFYSRIKFGNIHCDFGSLLSEWHCNVRSL
jgi:hypothetical protein